MYLFIVFALILQVYSDICDVCVCRFNSKNVGDYEGESVDCSYVDDVFKLNHTLPVITHSLDLSSANLTRVYPNEILHSKTMNALFLNRNAITEITPDALKLPELRTLDLSDNLLHFIDQQTFRNVKKLEILNLANNMFTSFEMLTFHPLSGLREIVLDNNDIGPSLQEVNLFDRSGFGLTHKIERLSISGINLNRIPDNFFVDAYNIRKLVISNNSISDVFELPFTLEYLDLSDNPVQEIEGEDFNDLPGLKVLKLNNLGINEVPEYAFASLHDLMELDLERNENLTEFSKLAFGREVLDDADDFVLERLSLKNCRLWRLDMGLKEPLGQLIHLDLQGNPWKCDCNLLWIKELQIPDKDNEHLRCQTPKAFFNARISSLNAKYFVCTPNKHHIGLAISAIAVCVILACIAIWFFVFVPKYYKRSNILRSMYAPSTAYSVLPMSTTIRRIDDF